MHINDLDMLRGLLSLTHLSFLLVFTLSAFGLENKMFRKKTVQLFPPVTGKLTNNGSPLHGVKVKEAMNLSMLPMVKYMTTRQLTVRDALVFLS